MRNHYQGVWVCSIQGPVLTTTSVWGCSNTAPAGILNTHEELARATKYYQSNGEWWKYNHLSCSLCLRRPLSSSYKPLVFFIPFIFLLIRLPSAAFQFSRSYILTACGRVGTSIKSLHGYQICSTANHQQWRNPYAWRLAMTLSDFAASANCPDPSLVQAAKVSRTGKEKTKKC